jgi:inorganic pyrophosphatase
LKVFIENEAGSYVKHLHNEKTLELKGTTQVSRPYPLPYGFVLDTSAEDGDNVDCFVLTNRRLHTGDVVECEPVGLMEQIEDDEIDHKVLAVLAGEERIVDRETRQTLIGFANHVFDHVPGKKMQVGKFRDREAAIDFLTQRSKETAAY